MAIHAILTSFTNAAAAATIPVLGLSAPELGCYMLFL
jgi:hypothetical protein